MTVSRISPSHKEFLSRSSRYGVIPIVCRIDHCPDPVNVLESLGTRAEFLLESGKFGRYSYLGGNASQTLSIESTTRATLVDQSGAILQTTDAPLELLHSTLQLQQIDPHPELGNFPGGAIGFFSYDFVRLLEELPDLERPSLGIPLCRISFPEWAMEFDHMDLAVRIVRFVRLDNVDGSNVELERLYHKACEELESLSEAVASTRSSRAPRDLHTEADPRYVPSNSDSIIESGRLTANQTQEEFCNGVKKAIEYIHEGDVFQVNLSLRFEQDYSGSDVDLYRRLRTINPSPYMTFLRYNDFSVVGASPEMLVKVHGRTISSRPIAGTRKRGRSTIEDDAVIDELMSSEKERAEHLMLVDLERNDLGRVCEHGSVRVEEFMGIERYSHVTHIVSHITGELRDDVDAVDIIRAMFPGGTITGAPKIRCMEIIEELEPDRREMYTGSIGWIGYNGDIELNIVIRTILLKGGKAFLQAGAGIVADSVPEHEYRECLRKAEASFHAFDEVVK